MSVYQYVYLAITILLLVTRLDAACNIVDNKDNQYNCQSGSINDLKQIPSNAERIQISNMTIRQINETLFSHFGNNLVVLRCSHCLITDIEDNAFRRLKSLKFLSLNNNYLKELKPNWFEGLIYLIYLDLSYNNIKSIDNDVFRNAPAIVDLRLSGNPLVCLDPKSISMLHLKRIVLNDTPKFRCPNAMMKYLNEKNINYTADPYWSNIDQMPDEESLPSVSSPLVNLTDSIIITTTFNKTPRIQPPTSPSSLWSNITPSYNNRPITTETPSWSTIASSVPSSKLFNLSEVTPQQINNYRGTGIEEINMNKGTNVATAMLSVECPNAASHLLINLFLLIAFTLIANFCVNDKISFL